LSNCRDLGSQGWPNSRGTRPEVLWSQEPCDPNLIAPETGDTLPLPEESAEARGVKQVIETRQDLTPEIIDLPNTNFWN
jgi:hypothetical protein